MHQIEVFIQHTRQSTPSSTGMIVALHANKPHGMGNIYDHHQSPTAAYRKACQGQYLSPDAQMLVLEAMPLLQFPGRCGRNEGIKPPFTHLPRYPPQAWALGRLILHIQLMVVRNSLGRPAADFFKAMLMCGRWACAWFGLTSGQMSQAPPAIMEPLFQDTARPLPCASTFHPSAIEWRGNGIAQDFAFAFAQVAAVVSGEATSMTLAPAFTSTSIQQLQRRLSVGTAGGVASHAVVKAGLLDAGGPKAYTEFVRQLGVASHAMVKARILDAGGPEAYEEFYRQWRARQQQKYAESAKGKVAKKKYAESAKGKVAQKKYAESATVKEARRKRQAEYRAKKNILEKKD